MHKYVFNFLRDHRILTTLQSGLFCKAVDEGKEVRGVFCDISRAFIPGHSTVHNLIEPVLRNLWLWKTMKLAVIYSVIYPKHLIVFGKKVFFS